MTDTVNEEAVPEPQTEPMYAPEGAENWEREVYDPEAPHGRTGKRTHLLARLQFETRLGMWSPR